MSKVGPNHPLHRLKSKKNWIAGATAEMKSKGSEGSLTRIAKQHGESAMEFAHEHVHDKKHPRLQKKSQFAINANK